MQNNTMQDGRSALIADNRQDRMLNATCLLLKRLQFMSTPNLDSTMSTPNLGSTMSTVLKSEIVSLGKSSIYSTSENITSTVNSEPNHNMDKETSVNETSNVVTHTKTTTETQNDKPTENPNKYSKERHLRMKHIAENDKVIRSFDNFCKKHKCGAQRSLLRGAMYMKSVQF